MAFVLHEVLGVERLEVPGYAELSPDFTRAVIAEAGRLAAEVLAPLNPVGDREGCRLENGVVRTPAGFRAAFEALRAGGWTALDCDPEHGGQGLPYLLNTAVCEMFVSANMALNMYQGLTHGAYSALRAHGSPEQKRLYLPKLASCEWTGTMNLTEPHAGTDLGLIRTRAEPRADGTYAITGQKIFISAGDHDLAENIVHLVLAKAPGGGEGTRGISLFLVPKFLVNPDGSLGPRNAVSVGKIERKMGIHGNATCVMDYDGATGFLVGELHRGMRAMFTMMNEARLGVGLQGYAMAEVAFQNARAWARERLQGRAAAGPANPGGPADPILVHPDVRRLLMEQKSFVEAARALTLWGALLIDRAERAGDGAAHGLISLLTPVIKGFLTDRGFEMCVAAQQVFGGHGYIEDTGLSQFVRDARIAMIYEGANGVQALDLVGRKLGAEGGRHLMAFLAEAEATVRAARADARLAEAFARPLAAAAEDLRAAAMFFLAEAPKDPNAALAGSTDFLHLFGHTALGLMWARMALAAQAALDAGRGDPAFLSARIATGRFYMARALPATLLHRRRIETGAGPVMALAPADL
jgi:alkylation response protein AidB-like acyl-CoA dehydrogenase